MRSYEETKQRLTQIPDLSITEDAPLSRYTRFGIGGPARLLLSRLWNSRARHHRARRESKTAEDAEHQSKAQRPQGGGRSAPCPAQ